MVIRDLEINFIIDRSGSMNGLEKDTIGGYNSFLQKYEDASGRVTINTYLFSNHYKLFENNTPIEKAKKMTEEDYYVGGCTALLDTVGTAITESNRRNIHQLISRIFVIITDGLENASVEYTLPKVKELIKDVTNGGDEFIFLGADIDAFASAESIGIKAARASNFTHDGKGMRHCFATMARVVQNFREEGVVRDDWAKE
jgi:hypothetical protein